jgi:hypothetical protein
MHELFVNAVAGAAESASPIDAIGEGLQATLLYFADIPRELAQQRRAVIASNAGLQERELIKYSTLEAGIADALCKRGTGVLTANLTAATAVSLFRVAVQSWIEDTKARELSHHIHESLVELKALAADS